MKVDGIIEVATLSGFAKRKFGKLESTKKVETPAIEVVVSEPKPIIPSEESITVFSADVEEKPLEGGMTEKEERLTEFLGAAEEMKAVADEKVKKGRKQRGRKTKVEDEGETPDDYATAE